MFTADDDVIVEWRAVTVGLLDELLVEVNSLLGLNGSNKLNLAQMLEAGSWKVRRHSTFHTPHSTFHTPHSTLLRLTKHRVAEKSQK